MLCTLRLRRAACCLLLATLSACTTIGPASIRDSRNAYNVAIQQTSNEQLLLNIVRLKYRDTPTFLELTSVTSRFTLEAKGEAGATLESGTTTPVGIGGAMTFADEPTVSYTPLQGDRFVRQVLSPIDLSTIVLLFHSGWSIERILRVCVQRANRVDNAPTASGPTPERAPHYASFLHIAHLLRELQNRGVLQVGYRRGAEQPVVEMEIAERALAWPEVEELTDHLGLKKGTRTYTLNTDVRARDGDALGLVTRSLMGILFYVSQGVEVPVRDAQAGRVTVTRDAEGTPFDWRQVTGDLMQIRSSDERPADGYVAVHYRGSWFYISDTDLSSKSTFSLLTQLFALQAGEIKSAGPILTLPVGR